MIAELSSAGIGDAFTDADCLRFLEARKFSAEKATEMALQWHNWYCKAPLPKFTGRMLKEVAQDFDFYPSTVLDFEIPGLKEFNERHSCYWCMHGDDRDGNPIFWEQTGKSSHNYSSMLDDLTQDDMVSLHIRRQELMVRRIKDNSVRYGRSVEKFVVVSDLKGLTVSLDPASMSMFLKLSALDQASYPERLKKLFFINTPLYFTALWGLVWPFLHPTTVGKITILGENFLPTLQEFIDDASIPTEYGGTMISSWNVPDNCPWDKPVSLFHCSK